jgi:hypothetical protein
VRSDPFEVQDAPVVLRAAARSVEPAAVVDRLAGIGAAVFADLDELGAVLLPAFQGRRPPTSGELGIEARAAALLRRAGERVVGLGFVAAPGTVRDVTHWLEWWTADGPASDRRIRRLVVQSDPAADDFRDYTTLPWFRVPERTGQPHVTGPYVDYLCTDEYTLTFTAPVSDRGRFLGVVGADVVVSWVEDQLDDLLLRCAAPTTVVNASGRVLTSTVGSVTTGDLVREVPTLWKGVPDPAGRVLLRCDALPFALLVEPRDRPA